MRSDVVIDNSPVLNDVTGFSQVGTQVLVQALISDPAIEGFDKPIL